MILKAHRWNAILLVLFLAIHFGSHLGGVLGPSVHAAVLEGVRPFYRSAIIEPLLFAALIAQIMLGLALVWRRRSIGIDRSWGLTQIASGLYIATFAIVHGSSALFARYANQLDTNFWWPASTLAHDDLRYFFYPYYFLGVVAIFAHLASALHFRSVRAEVVRTLVLAGPLVALIVLSGFGGWYRDFLVPSVYMDALNAYVSGRGSRP